MRELMFSMMRFSGAITMFGMEQVQNAISAPTNTRAALVRLCNTLDSMSESLASKLDAPKRTALDSMSKSQLDIWDNTASAVKLDAAFGVYSTRRSAWCWKRDPKGTAARSAGLGQVPTCPNGHNIGTILGLCRITPGINLSCVALSRPLCASPLPLS